MAEPFGAVSRSLREAGRTLRGVSRDVAESRVQRGRERLGLARLREEGRAQRGKLELETAMQEREVRRNQPITWFQLIEQVKERGGAPGELLAGMESFFQQDDPLDETGEAKLGDAFTTEAQAIKQFIQMRTEMRRARTALDAAEERQTGQKAVAGIRAGATVRAAEIRTGEVQRKAEETAIAKEKRERKKSESALRKEKKRRVQVLEKELAKLNIDMAKQRAGFGDEAVIGEMQKRKGIVQRELREIKATAKEIIPDRKLQRTGAKAPSTDPLGIR